MKKHKKLKERILSLALSAAMVTTMLPTTVFATEGGDGGEDNNRYRTR